MLVPREPISTSDHFPGRIRLTERILKWLTVMSLFAAFTNLQMFSMTWSKYFYTAF